MKRQNADAGRLATQLASLPSLDRPTLKEYWRHLYGVAVPINASRAFLTYAIAYRLQEKVLGGLKPSTRRFLTKAAEDASAGKQVAMPSPTLKPGTRLIREWHGNTYEVSVLEDGFLFQGKQYRSLSKITRIITGVEWSGPQFFGIRPKKKGAT